MSVVAIKPYAFPAKDIRENFPAPLLFIGWEDHLMFASPVCLPLPADMPFGAIGSAVLPGVYGYHPDFERIDWGSTQWFKSGAPWQPDPAKSLWECSAYSAQMCRHKKPLPQSMEQP